MRRLLVPLAAVAVCGGGPATAAATPFVFPPFASPAAPALVTFGHSFVSGAGAVVVRPTWTQRAAKTLHLAPDNRGMSGTTSAEILQVVRAYTPRASDDVVIEAEMNDVRRHGTTGLRRYGQDLTAMLRHLTRARHRPHRIVVAEDPRPLQWTGGLYDYPGVYDKGSDAALAAYAAKTRAVVKGFHGVQAVDLDRGWDPAVDVSTADTLHPNAAGVARIATLVTAALR